MNDPVDECRRERRATFCTGPERGEDVFVVRFMLAVRSDKRAEFLSAVTGLIDRTLRLPGCSACRLDGDCSDTDGYFLVSEWQSRTDFVMFTGSRELQVLYGMRGLLSAEPRVVVDEVRKRTEGPLPRLPREGPRGEWRQA